MLRALLAVPEALFRTTGYVPGFRVVGRASKTLVRLQSCGLASASPTFAVPVAAPRLAPLTTIGVPAGTLLLSILSRWERTVRLGADATVPSARVTVTAPVSCPRSG